MKVWRWVTGLVVVAAVGVASWQVPQPATADDAVGPTVAARWAPGEPELGVQVYWTDDPADDDETLALKARRVFEVVVGLEANSVSVSFPFYSTSLTSNEVITDERTPSPGRVAIVLREAERLGLRTTLRPLLDERLLTAVDPVAWRGQLAPADPVAWFDGYLEFLLPYVRTAQDEGAETVTVGTEFNDLQSDPGWARVVDAVRAEFDGEIAYSANWDAYADAVENVPVDVVGIDAYPHNRTPEFAGITSRSSTERLTDAWADWLDATLIPGTPVLLSEVGASAESRTVANPAVPHTPGTALDTAVQSRWFSAACAAAADAGVRGLYWWKIEFSVDPVRVDPVADLHDSFLGRPAEDAARDCFAQWGSRS